MYWCSKKQPQFEAPSIWGFFWGKAQKEMFKTSIMVKCMIDLRFDMRKEGILVCGSVDLIRNILLRQSWKHEPHKYHPATENSQETAMF
jgi:hypothetical protein